MMQRNFKRLFSKRNEVNCQYFGHSRKWRDAWAGIWTSNFRGVNEIQCLLKQRNGSCTRTSADTRGTGASQFLPARHVNKMLCGVKGNADVTFQRHKSSLSIPEAWVRSRFAISSMLAGSACAWNFISHIRGNIDWHCLRIRFWGESSVLTGKKWQERKKNYIMSSLICPPYRIFLGWSNLGGCDGHSI